MWFIVTRLQLLHGWLISYSTFWHGWCVYVQSTMKKIHVLALGVGIFLAPSVFALTLTLEGGSGYGPYQTGSGGEFTFGIDNAALVANAYVSGVAGTKNVVTSPVATSFQTFCVEGSEFINGGGAYSAVYNNKTVFGNTALTKGAAYIYSQFVIKANFGGYLGATYNYSGARTTSAALVQNAIWAFMGQEGKTAATESLNPFFNAAVAAEGGTFALADTAAATGYHNVYVLNLTQIGTGKAAQDQLIYTEGGIPNVIPDGGFTIMLLGMGFTGFAFLSRRVRR
jgi:hypothetical protein